MAIFQFVSFIKAFNHVNHEIHQQFRQMFWNYRHTVQCLNSLALVVSRLCMFITNIFNQQSMIWRMNEGWSRDSISAKQCEICAQRYKQHGPTSTLSSLRNRYLVNNFLTIFHRTWISEVFCNPTSSYLWIAFQHRVCLSCHTSTQIDNVNTCQFVPRVTKQDPTWNNAARFIAQMPWISCDIAVKGSFHAWCCTTISGGPGCVIPCEWWAKNDHP